MASTIITATGCSKKLGPLQKKESLSTSDNIEESFDVEYADCDQDEEEGNLIQEPQTPTALQISYSNLLSSTELEEIKTLLAKHNLSNIDMCSTYVSDFNNMSVKDTGMVNTWTPLTTYNYNDGKLYEAWENTYKKSKILIVDLLPFYYYPIVYREIN